MRRRPTRRDLLVVVGRLQNLAGKALADYYNDRSQDRADRVSHSLKLAVDLCIEALGQDDQVKPSGPWAPEFCEHCGHGAEDHRPGGCTVRLPGVHLGTDLCWCNGFKSNR